MSAGGGIRTLAAIKASGLAGHRTNQAMRPRQSSDKNHKKEQKLIYKIIQHSLLEPI